MGDMLYMASAGTGFATRVSAAPLLRRLSTEVQPGGESYLKEQGEPDYDEGVLEGGTVDGERWPAGGEGGLSGEKDPMRDQAVEVVLQNRKGSISLVQRHQNRLQPRRAAGGRHGKTGLVSAMNGQPASPSDILLVM